MRIQDLYHVSPQEFTGARNELVGELRRGGTSANAAAVRISGGRRFSNRFLSAIQQPGRSWWCLGLLTLALIGCDARASAPSDPYDPTTMDFTSPPARITTARQTGPFAVGDVLSMTAALKPLDPAPVKAVRLDTTHKIIEISPGVKFSSWTFGDQVPGPTIRARVGDRIRFTMTNRSDAPVPGVRVTSAPMMHSIGRRSHQRSSVATVVR